MLPVLSIIGLAVASLIFGLMVWIEDHKSNKENRK